MSELVANCPRCGAQNITFDLSSSTPVDTNYGWQTVYEAFCVCRKCHRSTVFALAERGIEESKALRNLSLINLTYAVNDLVQVQGYISLKDKAAEPAPEHLPAGLKAAFDEGAKCLAVGCPNAAATMFRLCVDIATRSLLPEAETERLNARTRRDLGLRLPWLFDNGLLQEALRDHSTCIKEDGNDGAHRGTLKIQDAEDVRDFTVTLLERLYTEPAKLRINAERRAARRKPS
jgi:Domain of unknown function (DUF4145)